MKKIIVTVTVLNMLCCFAVYSHPGRLDSNGGHYNRQTGEYHYHDGTHHSGGNSSGSGYTMYELLNMYDEDLKRERQREEALKREEERRQELREQAERERLEKEEQKQKEKERYVSAAHVLYFVTTVAVILIIGAWQDYFSSKTKLE